MNRRRLPLRLWRRFAGADWRGGPGAPGEVRQGAVERAEDGCADEQDERGVSEGAEGVVPNRGNEVEAGVMLDDSVAESEGFQ